MTTPVELVSVVDLADRLELVLERDDEYPVRNLGERLRSEMREMRHRSPAVVLGACSLLDPTECDSSDVRARARCLIDTVRQWEAAARTDA